MAKPNDSTKANAGGKDSKSETPARPSRQPKPARKDRASSATSLPAATAQPSRRTAGPPPVKEVPILPTESTISRTPAVPRSRLLYIQLAFPEPTASAIRPDDSWFLAALSTFVPFQAFAFGAPGVEKSPDLGTIFPDLTPNADGTYTLELAALLPDRLPNLNGQTEYWLDVVEGEESTRLCFSNQMRRVLFVENERPYEAFVPNAALAARTADAQKDLPPGLRSTPAEPLATVATCRFTIRGATAEEALEQNLPPTSERFVRLLNRVVAANIVLHANGHPAINAEYELNTFPWMFFILRGGNNRLEHGRYVTNLFRAMMNPTDVNGEKANRLLSMVTGATPISDVTLLLNSARSLLAGGMLRQALLQLAIAVEAATRRYVHAALVASGSSKKKLKDVEKDLTFSIMLNVLLFSVAPVQTKPDRALVADIDSIRQLRNTLMHEGGVNCTREQIHHLYDRSLQFVSFLRAISLAQGLPQP